MNAEQAADYIRAKYKWRKVVAPNPWYPKDGEELVGFYGGRTLRRGLWGQYEVAVVHVPAKGAYTVAGVKVIQLIDAAMMAVGTPLRVVYLGEVTLPSGHSMKQFEVFVAEGDTIPAGLLPSLELEARDGQHS